MNYTSLGRFHIVPSDHLVQQSASGFISIGADRFILRSAIATSVRPYNGPGNAVYFRHIWPGVRYSLSIHVCRLQQEFPLFTDLPGAILPNIEPDPEEPSDRLPDPFEKPSSPSGPFDGLLEVVLEPPVHSHDLGLVFRVHVNGSLREGDRLFLVFADRPSNHLPCTSGANALSFPAFCRLVLDISAEEPNVWGSPVRVTLWQGADKPQEPLPTDLANDVYVCAPVRPISHDELTTLPCDALPLELGTGRTLSAPIEGVRFFRTEDRFEVCPKHRGFDPLSYAASMVGASSTTVRTIRDVLRGVTWFECRDPLNGAPLGPSSPGRVRCYLERHSKGTFLLATERRIAILHNDTIYEWTLSDGLRIINREEWFQECGAERAWVYGLQSESANAPVKTSVVRLHRCMKDVSPQAILVLIGGFAWSSRTSSPPDLWTYNEDCTISEEPGLWVVPDIKTDWTKAAGKQTISKIKRLSFIDSTRPIVVIGHSLGGSAAVDLTHRLNQEGVAVDLLVAIDPVAPTGAVQAVSELLIRTHMETRMGGPITWDDPQVDMRVMREPAPTTGSVLVIYAEEVFSVGRNVDLPRFRISGAEEHIVKGTTHTNVDDAEETYRLIRSAIRRLNR